MLRNIVFTLSMFTMMIMLAFGQAKAGNDDGVYIQHYKNVDESAYLNKVFPVHVNGASIEDLSKQYSCASPYAKLFEADKAHDCNIVLKPFPEGMTTDEIIMSLQKDGFKPATGSQNTSFGLQYPQFQNMRIIALGSITKIDGKDNAILIDHTCVQVSRSGCKWNANVFAATPISK